MGANISNSNTTYTLMVCPPSSQLLSARSTDAEKEADQSKVKVEGGQETNLKEDRNIQNVQEREREREELQDTSH